MKTPITNITGKGTSWLNSRSVPPVARAPVAMRAGKDNNLSRHFLIDDAERELTQVYFRNAAK